MLNENDWKELFKNESFRKKFGELGKAVKMGTVIFEGNKIERLLEDCEFEHNKTGDKN